MILYGAQGNVPRRSHTFATFIKVGEAGGDSTEDSFESHTISWLPANGSVGMLRLSPQPGKNFSLTETLSWARAQGAPVSAWGPFEVRPGGIIGGLIVSASAADEHYRHEGDTKEYGPCGARY